MKRSLLRYLPTLLASFLVCFPELVRAQHADKQTKAPLSFAVIVGNNQSLGARRPDLHYADDDAARYFEILSTLAEGRVSLLSAFDRDTQRLFPEAQRKATPPTRAELLAVGKRLEGEVRAAQLSGRETELYFVFAGHGDVAQGEGFVELADARFSSRDLEAWLRQIPFSRAHVILDSCNSFFMLGVRKPGGRHFATSEDAARALSSRLPNVGVFLSTSAEGEAFEWSEIQSGIFSHVVRSGLLGGADANADGSVSYLELAAFVDTATDDVHNPNMRPHVFARGPGASDSAPIVRLGNMSSVRRFELGDAGTLRVRLRDAHGLPLLDGHAETKTALRVSLPAAWAEGATIERTERNTVTQGSQPLRLYAVPDTQTSDAVTLAQLVELDPQSAIRGPAETFQSLFAQPFGPRALAAYTEARGAMPPRVYGVSEEDKQRMEFVLDEIAKAERSNRVSTVIGTLGVGAVLAVAGIQALQFDRSLPRSEKRKPRAIGGTLLGAGGVFLAGGTGQIFARSDGEQASEEFRRVVREGGDTTQAFADADKRLQSLLRERRNDRLGGAIVGSVMMAGSVAGLTWSELETASIGKRRDRRLIAGGCFVVGAMMLGDSLITSTTGETLTKVWRDDPSLNQYQPSISLAADGAMLNLTGTW